jgi:hypothetical protein
MMTDANKLTVRGEKARVRGCTCTVSEIWITENKGQTKSNAQLRESRRVCVWPRGP